MLTEIQYNTDANGNPTSVIVPYQEWKKLNERHAKLKRKVQLLTGLQDAMREVKKARQSGEKLSTLTDFINESRG